MGWVIIINGDGGCSFWWTHSLSRLASSWVGAILHSSNEPGELSQWLCHDDSTINIVVVVIIIITSGRSYGSGDVNHVTANPTRLSLLKGKVHNVTKNFKIYTAPSRLKQQRQSVYRKLNQLRSKLDPVDQPLRTARTIVHGTQWYTILQHRDGSVNIPLPPHHNF